MEKQSTKQEEIAEWFDNTYKQRANLYLRPIEAYEVFLSLLDPQKGDKLLDVACGVGRILQAAEKYQIDGYGIDISKQAVLLAKKNLPNANIQVANAETIPFPDDYFDAVTCIGSLERFLSLETALKEQIRVTKKGGKLCVMVRNSNTLRWQILKKGLGMVNKKGHQGAKDLETWTSIFENLQLQIINVYRDQWPIKKLKKWSTLGLKKVDYASIEAGLLPIQYSGEFIFLLKKK